MCGNVLFIHGKSIVFFVVCFNSFIVLLYHVFISSCSAYENKLSRMLDRLFNLPRLVLPNCWIFSGYSASRFDVFWEFSIFHLCNETNKTQNKRQFTQMKKKKKTLFFWACLTLLVAIFCHSLWYYSWKPGIRISSAPFPDTNDKFYYKSCA